MARPPEELRRRLDELIVRCDDFRSKIETPEPVRGGIRFQMPISEQWRFLLSSLQTVKNACGADSPHLRELEMCRNAYLQPDGALDLDRCRGVLRAASDDLASGMLLDIRQLVAAETFGDVLETAAYLLQEGHHLPAIALAGAVLESSLRTLAKARGVAWTGQSGISRINTELYKSSVYDKIIYGEIEAWAKLRNKVDHGDFTTPGDIDIAMATRMLDGIRHFIVNYR